MRTVDGAVEAIKELALWSGDNNGRAKINQLDPEVIVDHNILVLDIPMTDPTRVQVIDTLDNLLEDHPGLGL